MKNRFIQMFLVICAVMLIICTVSVWAAAEDVTATPTDLAPVEQEESVPETTETEATADGEEGTDGVEIIITKAVRIGDTWSGAMKKTKPAVLKLDVDIAQQVNLVVLGRHAWITVEKSDRLTENPVRILTDDETSQTVISWHAEEGSYLITMGPVEPNIMAKLNVYIMDDASYENWLTEQKQQEESENAIEESSEEEGEGMPEEAEEPEEVDEELKGENSDIPVENEPDGSEDEEESAEIEDDTEENIDEMEEQPEETEEPTDETETETEQQNNEEEQPEKENEAEDIIDEELLLSLGYYKVQVALSDGADLFETMEESEPVEHMETGDELWVKTTDNEIWAIVYNTDETLKARYVKWDDLIIVNKPDSEQEEEEVLPARYIKITSTIADYKYIALGTEITMTAELFNFRDDDICEYQWKYYDEAKEEYVDIEGANELTYSYGLTYENIYYNWKLVVTLINEEE